MAEIIKKAGDIQPGDAVFHQDYPTIVTDVFPGFWANSRIIQWGADDTDWCCVEVNADIAVAVT